MQKIKTIVLKEWAEVFKNRMVLFTVIFLPLIFAVLPLGTLYSMRSMSADMGDISSAGIPVGALDLCPADLSAGECFQVYLASQFMILFMITPLIIPINIAAYSIVGEKTTRSLEPLLATPITTVELLMGKNLAATIPAALATWGGFLLYALGAVFIVTSPRVVATLFNPLWWLAVLFVGPLLAILSVNFSLMISSRVNDPRVAEQLSSVIIMPVMVLFFGQITGFLILNQWLVLLLTLLLIGADVLVIYLAVQFFQRENILTRWK
ncbi:MAG: ABC transporter permease subunit [Anaerolineae bacterium]|nr:ABC transporter permease subunit [Anaerolineae bacterium]